MASLAPVDPTPPRWELYRVLSDPMRLRLLCLTAEAELGVSELAEILQQSQPKVSRHCAALRDAGLVAGRKQGTWVLLRLAPKVDADPVVADALRAGRRLCDEDGALQRVPAILAARDRATREFFARGDRASRAGPPDELAAYLRPFATLLPSRRLAVDAGTGDGALLEVLAPVFDRVVAIDRSEPQLALARARAEARGFDNVHVVRGELDGRDVTDAVAGGADAVFAARVLHHAPVPDRAFADLVSLAAPPPGHGPEPGGAVVVLDYESHRDETLREREADLWLGFAATELRRLAHRAGLVDLQGGRVPGRWNGSGPDAHLVWLWLTGRRGAVAPSNEGPDFTLADGERTPKKGRAVRRPKRGNET
ncbi:MAG: metalloregulator ArsR/SmtB family transcription factor [Myxococcota bacterium]